MTADWSDIPCATCAFATWRAAATASEDGYAAFIRGCLHPLMEKAVACRPLTACDEHRPSGLHPVLRRVQDNEGIVIEFPVEEPECS